MASNFYRGRVVQVLADNQLRRKLLRRRNSPRSGQLLNVPLWIRSESFAMLITGEEPDRSLMLYSKLHLSWPSDLLVKPTHGALAVGDWPVPAGGLLKKATMSIAAKLNLMATKTSGEFSSTLDEATIGNRADWAPISEWVSGSYRGYRGNRRCRAAS